MVLLDMLDEITFHKDAFSSGQISSKIWLCRELENLHITEPQIVWVYGGWYGIVSLLILSREKFPIKHIRSFDVNPECEPIADTFLENWVWQSWKFKAMTADCNYLDFVHEKPDIIINCSTEHFDSDKWFQRVPVGTLMALQSNNMTHEDHCSCFNSCIDFSKKYNFNHYIRNYADGSHVEWYADV